MIEKETFVIPLCNILLLLLGEIHVSPNKMCRVCLVSQWNCRNHGDLVYGNHGDIDEKVFMVLLYFAEYIVFYGVI